MPLYFQRQAKNEKIKIKVPLFFTNDTYRGGLQILLSCQVRTFYYYPNIQECILMSCIAFEIK